MRFWLVALLFVTVILLSTQIQSSDGASRKKRKNARKKGEHEEDSVVYTSEADKLIKLAEMKEKLLNKDKPDKETQDATIIALRAHEKELRIDLVRSIVNHGDDSVEKATSLHLLGRNLYHQEKFEDVVEASQEIVRIHEITDGPESVPVAQALGNVGSVSFRLGNKKDCRLAMERALYILIKEFGDDGKEVMMHRAKMLTFQIEEGRDSSGLSYEDYKDEL